MENLSLEINMDKDSFQRGFLAVLEYFAVHPATEAEQSLDLSLGLQAMVCCLRHTTVRNVFTK